MSRIAGALLCAILLTAVSAAPAAGGGAAPPAGTREPVVRVPSGSMEPTLKVGDLVSVRVGEAPRLGAIVVYHPPQGFALKLCGRTRRTVTPGRRACDSIGTEEASVTLVKRVVAGPGESVFIRGGHVYRRPPGRSVFLRERDPYTRRCGASRECDFPVPVTIPAGSWYLLGDNRGESDDSRFNGPIPSAWIVGDVAGVVGRGLGTLAHGVPVR